MNYLINIPPIEDDVILATDPDTGKELLRFGVQVAGRWVKCEYPKHGKYPSYLNEVAAIFSLFSSDDEDIRLPDDMTGLLKLNMFNYEHLIRLKAVLLTQKALIGKRIEKSFYEYLSPTLDTDDGKTLSPDETRKWISENAGIDVILNMFCAFLEPDQMLKKKSRFVLTRIFPDWTKQQWRDISSKSLDGTKKDSMELPNFEFD